MEVRTQDRDFSSIRTGLDSPGHRGLGWEVHGPLSAFGAEDRDVSGNMEEGGGCGIWRGSPGMHEGQLILPGENQRPWPSSPRAWAAGPLEGEHQRS